MVNSIEFLVFESNTIRGLAEYPTFNEAISVLKDQLK